MWIEKIDLSCSDNLCGSGKCFQINDPSFPHVCLCLNGEFAISCQSNDVFCFYIQSKLFDFYIDRGYKVFIYDSSNGCKP